MREIIWFKQARKEFETFPASAREDMQTALDIAALGGKADIAKPMKGLGSGVMEIALSYRTDAYRVIYAVQFGDDLWVIHASKEIDKWNSNTSKRSGSHQGPDKANQGDE